MRIFIVYLLIIIPASLVYTQSRVVYDSNTSLYLGPGTDLCAALITMDGTFSGTGTFCNSPVDVGAEKDLDIPAEFSLSQNYPNPFNPNTIISFAIPKEEETTLTVFDVLGRQVEVLLHEIKSPGYYNISFNAGGLPSGIYFYKIDSGSFTSTMKMILLR
jgi:hypothetical protein